VGRVTVVVVAVGQTELVEVSHGLLEVGSGDLLGDGGGILSHRTDSKRCQRQSGASHFVLGG
jgi:hypothetical protein